MTVFDDLESAVRSYARAFPVVFRRARGAYLYDQNERAYLDFLAGAGTLNYGHNNPHLKHPLLDYIQADGITHSLDLHTDAKARFLHALDDCILRPRGLRFRVQFTGPTGANAVEAALKIARRVTGRHNVISFTNGFHGVTLGALAATGNSHHRDATGIPLAGVDRFPYCGYLGKGLETLTLLEQMLSDGSSGIDAPAAVIVETIQGEGGLNVASPAWMRGLQDICRRHGILLIVDDIQAGCGRTGTFFSFESMGVTPDIVTLSKSLSGYGLPLAVTLINPDLDAWQPGEHNGTFRGNNHAFVTATAALETYWRDTRFAESVQDRSRVLESGLVSIANRYPDLRLVVKGRGMMRGLATAGGTVATAIRDAAFRRGLVIETSGAEDQVVKCLCPLTIEVEELRQGLELLGAAVAEVHRSGLRKVS